MLEATVRSLDRAPPRSRVTQSATEKLVQIESLRLHHFPATRSARAKWILYETVGDAFETVVVDLYRRAQYRPEFLLLNPNHNVPVLEICWASGETTTMLESAATADQAATYSEVRHYLKAVAAARSLDPGPVLAKMRELPVNDAFATDGHLREDGQMVHNLYLVRVKAPAESKEKGDYLAIVQELPGEEVFQTFAESACPLVKK